MANILDVLEEWGCNIDEGLARLGDDEAFYETLLAGFVRDNGMKELQAAMKAGDYRRAFEAAHGLKGDTGNLSLTPLYKAICSLVDDLRPAYEGCSPGGNPSEDYYRVCQLFSEFTEKVSAGSAL